MSIRKMKLKDYGITPGRAAELKEMVKDKQYYSLGKEFYRKRGISPDIQKQQFM